MIQEGKHQQTLTLKETETQDKEDVIEPHEEMENDVSFTDADIHRYFSRCNLPCKGMISEQRSLIKFLGSSWNELDYTRTEALFDLLFVDDDARQKQHPEPFSNTSDGKRVQESFPRLYINSGQKINVEDDLWTWRDEHSGPFSWMSRSQQDLTLLDLEPENVSKLQPKTQRVDMENPENIKNAEDPFENPANCWSRDIIDNYRKSEKNISLSPCTSIEIITCQSETDVDEMNPSVDGNNVANVHEPSAPQFTAETKPLDQGIESQNYSNETEHAGKDSAKDRRKRSPSPKKMLRSSSLRKSPSKCSDQGEQHLISKNSDDSYEEKNSFSNPLAETEWSSFVGENGNKKEDKREIALKSVPSMPAPQVMDRGSDMVKGSPYQVQNDNVHLITPNESPALASHSGRMYSVTNELSGWSAESTPDHNTHLLKGMESADVKKTGSTHHHFSPAVLEKYETDEVLTIESQGNNFKITTEAETKRQSDIPSTGFDFLDNW